VLLHGMPLLTNWINTPIQVDLSARWDGWSREACTKISANELLTSQNGGCRPVPLAASSSGVSRNREGQQLGQWPLLPLRNGSTSYSVYNVHILPVALPGTSTKTFVPQNCCTVYSITTGRYLVLVHLYCSTRLSRICTSTRCSSTLPVQ
jgi:hypothetical protein